MKRITACIIILIFLAAAVFSQDKKGSAALPGGYGSLTWGTLLSQARKNITGKLIYTDEKSIIISRDRELEYRYGFFYTETAAAGTGKKDDTSKAPEEGKLFYVALSFPYLSMDDVKKKLQEKYGEPTNENITDNQGALAWVSDTTIIVIWVDRYEKKAYSRRITYLSRKIARELNKYQENVFNATELELIKQLKP